MLLIYEAILTLALFVLLAVVQFNGGSMGCPSWPRRAIAPFVVVTECCGLMTLKAKASMFQVRPKPTFAASPSGFISALHVAV